MLFNQMIFLLEEFGRHLVEILLIVFNVNNINLDVCLPSYKTAKTLNFPEICLKESISLEVTTLGFHLSSLIKENIWRGVY